MIVLIYPIIEGPCGNMHRSSLFIADLHFGNAVPRSVLLAKRILTKRDEPSKITNHLFRQSIGRKPYYLFLSHSNSISHNAGIFRSEKDHLYRISYRGHCYFPPLFRRNRQTGLFFHFPDHALYIAFPFFDPAAYTIIFAALPFRMGLFDQKHVLHPLIEDETDSISFH